MKIAYYVINLDRSPDRLAAISADAAGIGLDLQRVPAVDGAPVSQAERRHILDEPGFRRLHGKIPMDGEYGCYASHLAVLDRFLGSDADAAVIFEDDVRPGSDFVPTVVAIAATDDWDLVKLMHHRLPAFRSCRTLGEGRELGLAWFGPTGSSACYLINRRAAQSLRQHLVPMRLPYDVALERGWALGLRVRHVRPDLVTGNVATQKSLIGGTKRYAAARLAPWRRITTLGFRTSELVRRAAYAARASERP